ncbi:MAG: hypothetical protein H7259_11380, partial [Cytophagales bacterium]|nr:hypothetical protein [Cytophaga sp.]
EIQQFLSSNPEYFDTYVLLASYYMEHKEYATAIPLLKNAATKVIPRKAERDRIAKLMLECSNHL